jgi:hypothetical protein
LVAWAITCGIIGWAGCFMSYHEIRGNLRRVASKSNRGYEPTINERVHETLATVKDRVAAMTDDEKAAMMKAIARGEPWSGGTRDGNFCPACGIPVVLPAAIQPEQRTSRVRVPTTSMVVAFLLFAGGTVLFCLLLDVGFSGVLIMFINTIGGPFLTAGAIVVDSLAFMFGISIVSVIVGDGVDLTVAHEVHYTPLVERRRCRRARKEASLAGRLRKSERQLAIEHEQHVYIESMLDDYHAEVKKRYAEHDAELAKVKAESIPLANQIDVEFHESSIAQVANDGMIHQKLEFTLPWSRSSIDPHDVVLYKKNKPE